MNSQSIKTPSLRFPGFVDSWQNSLLGDYLEFKNGFNAEKSQYGIGEKFINVLDIINDAPIVHDSIIGSVRMTEAEFKNYEVRYGDILFQRSSETREEVGQSNVYLDKNSSATFGGFVIRGNAKQEYDPLFFHYLLKTDPVRKDITSRSGGSTRYNIGQESLRAVSIVIPTRAEQQRIAAFLSAVDERVGQLTQKKELLLKYKNGVIQQIFDQRIRFKDEKSNDFSEWENSRLGAIGQIIGGGTPETDKTEYWGGNISWFTPTEIKSKYIEKSARTLTELGLKRSSATLLPKGTLLLSSRATVGDVGIALDECCTNQGFQSIIVNENNLNEFLYYWLTCHKNELLRRANGSTFLEISKSEIAKIPILLPSKPEQSIIAKFLSSIDDKIRLVNGQLKAARAFKQNLLQQMFV